MTVKYLCLSLMIAMTLSVATHGDEKKQSRSERRLANIEKRYDYTGDMQACVNLRRLRESTVIDDQTIFFRGLGKRGYINRLPSSCPSLARERRFSFSTTIAQLCRGEVITVLDSFGRVWGSCGLGEFEQLERKDKDKETTAPSTAVGRK